LKMKTSAYFSLSRPSYPQAFIHPNFTIPLTENAILRLNAGFCRKQERIPT
jgi:hypothetical protein